jgi:hypothetical protein
MAARVGKTHAATMRVLLIGIVWPARAVVVR